MLRRSELEECIKFHYELTGYGSKRLAYSLRSQYYGVSERTTLSILNSMSRHSKNTATFCNKTTLCPVLARKPMERHQIDLVVMTNHPVRRSDGKSFAYILSVLDIYSRYLWLRPISNKKSETIAKKLKSIYRSFGTPRIVQCDNGKEFKGAVHILCAAFQIKIIRGCPYHPQSQGKVERSHQSWKKNI